MDSLALDECLSLREDLATATSLQDLKTMTQGLERQLAPYHTGERTWTPAPDAAAARLPLPPWLCQPYVRIPPEDHLKKMQHAIQVQAKRARDADSDDDAAAKEGHLSKKQLKKMARKAAKEARPGRQVMTPCPNCPNLLVRNPPSPSLLPSFT